MQVSAPFPTALRSLLVGALALAPASALAHVVKTKDGKVHEGRVVVDDATKVVLESTFEGTLEFPRADVLAVDTATPPLRDQFAFRLDQAKDVPSLLALVDWARGKGFKAELEVIWTRIVALEPGNAKARKALGHVLVPGKGGGTWMTPAEKAAADAAAQEGAMRAKGLVLYQGRWVTPQEKAALEQGLVRDGDEWVTDEVFHTRRGERKVDGAWVRVGEAEGTARAQALSKALGLALVPLWGPHTDLVHELAPDDGAAVLDAVERVTAGFHRLTKPAAADGLDGLRVEVVIPHKAPGYAHYVQAFAKEQGIDKMAGLEGWATSASKLRSFWWTDPKAAIGAYLFPNTLGVLKSNVAHSTTFVLLNRYRFNFRFSSPWLQEGLAYFLELREVGPSSAFTIGRAGVPGGGDPTAWQDTTKWPDLLRVLALATQDTPMARIATSRADGLSICDLAKSWSVVKFLVDLDAAKFKAFLDATKAHRDEPDEAALQAVYGFDLRALEAKWHDAVTSAPAPAPAAPAPGAKKAP